MAERNRIPPPIPTAKGSRSAADPILSEQIDKSAQIPDLKLPHHFARSKPDEISYGSIESREDESMRRFFRSVRDFGAVRIADHGIPTAELRSALANCDRIFTVESCSSYGDHEQIDWGGDGDNRRIAGEAAVAIGDRNFEFFRQEMDNVSMKLEAIAKGLANVISQSGINQYREPIQFGESKFSIYRYHRANIIDQNSSAISETSHESGPYALSLHLFLEPGEFCLESGLGFVSFETRPESLVVTTRNELEEWSNGGIKSVEGKFIHKPFLLHTSKASFSLRQKWTFSKLNSDKTITLSDQILILFVIILLYKLFSYIFY